MSQTDLDRNAIDRETLLAEIYANPEDRALREVYADVLQAAGDPRGEFIALQLRDNADPRARALWNTHWQDWLGPLAACTDRIWTVFWDGFLHTYSIRQIPPDTDLATLASSKLWSTVRALSIWLDSSITTVPPHELARVVAMAPLPPMLERISASHDILAALPPTTELRTALLVVKLDEGDRFELDLALARGGEVTLQRGGLDAEDPADIEVWERAAAAACTQLRLHTEGAWSSATTIASAIASAVAGDRPRPPCVTYAFAMHVVELAGDVLTVACRNEADVRFEEFFDALSPALPKFATIRVGIGDPLERTFFEGDNTGLSGWLASRPAR